MPQTIANTRQPMAKTFRSSSLERAQLLAAVVAAEGGCTKEEWDRLLSLDLDQLGIEAHERALARSGASAADPALRARFQPEDADKKRGSGEPRLLAVKGILREIDPAQNYCVIDDASLGPTRIEIATIGKSDLAKILPGTRVRVEARRVGQSLRVWSVKTEAEIESGPAFSEGFGIPVQITAESVGNSPVVPLAPRKPAKLDDKIDDVDVDLVKLFQSLTVEQQKAVKAFIAKITGRQKPTKTQIKERYQTDRQPGETIQDFIKRVYGHWLTGEFTRADLRKIDQQAEKALRNWEHQHGKIPLTVLNLPTVKQRNDRALQERGGKDRLEELKLQSLARVRKHRNLIR